jgi:heme/copper-type cytochrome/quinol oxidase subunit 2
METTVPGKRQTSDNFYKKLLKLTVGGGVTFWATTIAFSLLPIAGEFRAEVSISYVQVVLVQSLIFGLIIEFLVSYFLVRFFDRIPTKNPILKSEILSFVALVIALIVLGVAASRTSDALQVFLIGATLNVPRFLIPGIIVGYLYKRL